MLGYYIRNKQDTGSLIDHPPKERAIGDVLLGPGRTQTPAAATLFATHAGHVQDLAPSVLPLLQPAVASCEHKNTQARVWREGER